MASLTDRLCEELAAVRGELTRLDAKCSTLAGLAGAALAFVVTQTGSGTLLARVLLSPPGPRSPPRLWCCWSRCYGPGSALRDSAGTRR